MTISLSITFIIVLVWVSTFNIGASNDYNDGTEVNNVAATATPFTTFKDDILKIKDAFVDTIDSIDTVNYKAESSE